MCNAQTLPVLLSICLLKAESIGRILASCRQEARRPLPLSGKGVCLLGNDAGACLALILSAKSVGHLRLGWSRGRLEGAVGLPAAALGSAKCEAEGSSCWGCSIGLKVAIGLPLAAVSHACHWAAGCACLLSRCWVSSEELHSCKVLQW